jgi:hypothetical protein
LLPTFTRSFVAKVFPRMIEESLLSSNLPSIKLDLIFSIALGSSNPFTIKRKQTGKGFSGRYLLLETQIGQRRIE